MCSAFFVMSLFRVIVFHAMILCVAGHGFMVGPKPDWRITQRAHCRQGGPEEGPGDECGGPCIKQDSWFHKPGAENEPTVWERGARESVIWTRNNHKSGFVRLSLVPLSERDSHQAHERGTFHFSCFISNPRSCKHDKYYCGTGKLLSSTEITVPNVPDGLYVLGWAWYGGGVEVNGKLSYTFGNYWSCAYLRIQGGELYEKNLAARAPSFDADSSRQKCKAISNRVYGCNVEPCTSKGERLTYLCPYAMTFARGRCQGRREPRIKQKEIKKVQEVKLKEQETREEEDEREQRKQETMKKVEEGKQKSVETANDQDRHKQSHDSNQQCPCNKRSRGLALYLFEMDNMRLPIHRHCLCSSRTTVHFHSGERIVEVMLAVVNSGSSKLIVGVNGRAFELAPVTVRQAYRLLGRMRVPVGSTIRFGVWEKGKKPLLVTAHFEGPVK